MFVHFTGFRPSVCSWKWLRCSGFAIVFVGCQSVAWLEAACVIVGITDVAEMSTELIVIVKVIPFHDRLLECAVQPLDLSVRPWMVWLG